jgi:sterol desaturase/sphingolipid hydroxylase (fatty acid hydroxylase superfamily)
MDISYAAIGLAIGVLIWLAARVWPMRRQPPGDQWWNALGLAYVLVLVALVSAGLQLAEDTIEEWGPVAAWQERMAGFHWVPMLLLYVLSVDFVSYLLHRALHTRTLWNHHAWHHSARNLNWVNGTRGAPLHVVLIYAPWYVMTLFFPFDAPYVVATGFMIFADFINQHLNHSNLRLPFARQLEWVFVTPRFHFVHHSADMKFTDTNYGSIFTFWDRLFGTYTPPEVVPANEPLGLDYEASHWRLMWGLPVKRRARRTLEPVAASSAAARS